MNAKKLAIALAASAAALCVAPAQATLTLSLQSGMGPITTITDGGVGDLNPTSNIIQASGILAGWSYNFETGFDNAPGAVPTDLHLSALAISTGAGTLTVTLKEDSFYIPSHTNSQFGTSVGGTTTFTSGSPVSAGVLLNGSLLGSVMTPALVPQPLGSSFAQVQASTGDTSATPFTLEQVLKITHASAGKTDANVDTQIVPEPAMLGLIGLGLLGLGFARRRAAKA